MRFVGGKISKNEGGVTVNTPSGALAIRGGMFQGKVGGGNSLFSFLYGVEMKFTGKNGQTQSVYEPGYTLDLSGGTATVRPTTAQDTNSLMAALTNSNTNTGPADTNKVDQQTQLVNDTISLQELISEANATKVDESLEADETDTSQQQEQEQEQEQEQTDTGTIEPTKVTVRVLTPANTYMAYGAPHYDPASNGILGGDETIETDDFEWTFEIQDGRLVGTVSGLVDYNGEGGPQVMTPAAVNFPTIFTQDQCAFGLGVCAVTDATITQGETTDTFSGWAVLKQDFYAYHLVEAPDFGLSDSYYDYVPYNNSPDQVLAFGGKKHDFGTPTGKTYVFVLTPDVVAGPEGAISPFASAGSSPEVNPDGPAPSISPLLYKESSPTTGRAVWLQTGIYINTTPADGETPFDQQSWVNIALGGTGADGGLIGVRRGGASVDIDTCNDGCINREAVAFTGDIATLSGPDGQGHFLGKDNPNIVIGFDSTNPNHNIGRDTPLDPSSTPVQNQTGSTYHVGVGVGTLPQQQQTFNGEFQGYAAGIVQSEVPSGGFTNVVAGTTPDDFTINFNPATNSLSADLIVRDVQNSDSATTAYNIHFGDNGQSAAARSAFIDNLHYAAIEAAGPGAAIIDYNNSGGQYTHASSTAYLVGGDQLNVTKFFPETFAETSPGVRPFCTGCDFIKWGAWARGSRLETAIPTNMWTMCIWHGGLPEMFRRSVSCPYPAPQPLPVVLLATSRPTTRAAAP